MKSLKNITIIFLLMVTGHVAFAQKMKEPVRVKLKNGPTLIVAQNEGFNKVYARVTIENQTAVEDNDVQLFRSFLDKKTTEFNNNADQDKEVVPHVELAVSEANTASNLADFEQTLQYVADHFYAPQTGRIKSSDMYITIAGDIDVAKAKALVNKMFAKQILATL